jgi:hypothetical protein
VRNERTAFALNRHRAASESGANASAAAEISPNCVPLGVELLTLRVGLPETDETGMVETRTGLGSHFVTPEPPPRRSSPLIDQAEPTVEGFASAFNTPCHDFRLKPGCAPGERTPLAPQEIGTAGTLERDRPADHGPPSPPPRSRRRRLPNLIRPTKQERSPRKVRPLDERKESADSARIRSMNANVIRVRSKACRSAG